MGPHDDAAAGAGTIGIDAAGKVIQDILALALDAHGDVAPDAASVLGLRREKTRDTVLRAFVEQVAPSNINPALWLRWMAGGEEPYAPARLSRAGSDKHASGRILDRASERIQTQEARRDRARAKVEQAQRELEIEDRALANAHAMDNAILQWVVSEHLARIIAPVFAMGPAWTMMRICSAHVSDEDMTAELAEADPEDHELRRKLLLEDRAGTSHRILAGLDLWSGDAEFEGDLRAAIEDVVRRFAPRDHQRVAQNERVRGSEERATSARPSAALDRHAMLAGLRADAAWPTDENDGPERHSH